MTKSQFIDAWKYHLAGLALFGVASEQVEGPLSRTRTIFKTTSEVEGLLARMHDAMNSASLADMADLLITKFELATEQERTVVIEKLRGAFSKGKK